MDLGDCAVTPIVVTSCIRGVQSCVSAAGYKQGSFFTQHMLESIRSAIADARGFKSSSSFDSWDGICSGSYSSFVDRYCDLFDAHLNCRKEESCQHLRSSNWSGGDIGVAAVSSSKSPASKVVTSASVSDVDSNASSVRPSLDIQGIQGIHLIVL